MGPPPWLLGRPKDDEQSCKSRRRRPKGKAACGRSLAATLGGVLRGLAAAPSYLRAKRSLGIGTRTRMGGDCSSQAPGPLLRTFRPGAACGNPPTVACNNATSCHNFTNHAGYLVTGLDSLAECRAEIEMWPYVAAGDTLPITRRLTNGVRTHEKDCTFQTLSGGCRRADGRCLWALASERSPGDSCVDLPGRFLTWTRR